MRLSLANIELVKKIIQFSTVFTTFFNGFGRSQNSKQPFLWLYKVTLKLPLPQCNLRVVLRELDLENEQNGQKYKGFANR